MNLNPQDLSVEDTLRLLSHFSNTPTRSITISVAPDFYRQAADEIKELKQNNAFLEERLAYLEGNPKWAQPQE